jgi:cytochrome c oxidase subunit 2
VNHSALDPAGLAAAAIHHLFAVMLVLACVAYLVVMGTFVTVIRRKARGAGDGAPPTEARARVAVIGSVAATAVILLGLLVYNFGVARDLAHPPTAPAVTVTLTGHQWWWEVEYEDANPQRRVLLANELHVPVGQPVLVKLVSHDVIHSFWVPSLSGKKDLIPGHPAALWIRADRAGTYGAPCAEFCGAEHAKMQLAVVAEPVAEFDAWLAAQRAVAAPPADSLAIQGREVFEARACSSCHAIRSTLAAGRVGPNLDHIASRLYLAAGSLRNTPGNLTAWIADPQTVKPGAQMPLTGLSAAELRAVVAFLETLR